MSTANSNNATAAGEPGSQATPTITRYEQLASEFTAALDKAIELLPQLEMEHPSTVAFVRGHRSIPVKFLRTAASVVEQEPTLRLLEKADPAATRDAVQFREAFSPVLDKVLVFARSLKFTMDAKVAEAAANSLQILAVAKGLMRDPGSATLAAHVENMTRDLGRRRPRPRAATPPPFVLKAA